MLNNLDRATSIRRAKLGASAELDVRGAAEHKDSFLDWYYREPRRQWKRGWASFDKFIVTARSVSTRLKNEFGVSEPEDLIDMFPGTVRPGDWLLRYSISGDALSEFRWMFVDLVEKVSRSDRDAWSRHFPNQAAQVHPIRAYGPPPFRIDPTFRRALQKVAKRFGLESDTIKPRASVVPRKRFIDAIARELQSDA